MFGFLNVRKVPGPTSHDVVERVRRLVGRGVSVGHAGTLDPFAEGVLVVCLGPATRLADYVQASPKRYSAVVLLGASSTTDDPEGRITTLDVASPPAEQAVREVLLRFVGKIRQVPPAHSAVHVGGRRAYKLARAGRMPQIAPRTVVVHSLELRRYEYPLLEIDVSCGRGTYIRALARDIGAALGTGGYCLRLTRTAVGPFDMADARPVEDVDPSRDLLSPLLALGEMPRFLANRDQVRRIASGNPVRLPAASPQAIGYGHRPEGLAEPLPFGRRRVEVAVLDPAGRLLAIAWAESGSAELRPRLVFPRSPT